MKTAPAKPVAPEPPPCRTEMDSGFKRSGKSRETIRPMVGGAPRPVTRPIEQKAARKAPAPVVTEQPTAQPACHGCVAQVGEFHSPECPAVNAFTAGRIQAIPRDLLERCAAMHLTLLAQARDAYSAGEPGSDRELAWLMETGEQLLGAGELAL